MFLPKILLVSIIVIVAAKECPKKTAGMRNNTKIMVGLVIIHFHTTDQCSKYEEFHVNDARGKSNGLDSLLSNYHCQNTCSYYGRNFDCKVDNSLVGDCYCKVGYARIEECGECVSIKTNATCKKALPPTEGITISISYMEW